MKTRRSLSLMCLLGACLTAQAQQMDMDAMMKWGAADVIRYHVVGVYQGTQLIHVLGA